MLSFSPCLKCALVKAGYLGKAGFLRVDKMKGEEIDHAYRQLMETEREKEREKEKEAMKYMSEQRMNAYVWENMQEEKQKRKQQQKEEREHWKKTHPLHMHGLPANYPTPTATPSYQHRKPPGFKTDIGQQGYQKFNIDRGTAILTHDVFSSAPQVVMGRPPKASRATTGKPPPKQLLAARNPPPSRR